MNIAVESIALPLLDLLAFLKRGPTEKKARK